MRRRPGRAVSFGFISSLIYWEALWRFLRDRVCFLFSMPELQKMQKLLNEHTKQAIHQTIDEGWTSGHRTNQRSYTAWNNLKLFARLLAKPVTFFAKQLQVCTALRSDWRAKKARLAPIELSFVSPRRLRTRCI